jgi:hypothetical protein
MERTTWTDARLDDLAVRVDSDVRELRRDMNTGFANVRGEIADVRGEINGLRSLMLRIGGGIMASVLVAAVLPGF